MSESKFTPGPWKVGTDHLGDDLLVYTPFTAPNGLECKLAIAAPELFEALTFLTNACDAPVGRGGRLTDLPAALDRARAALLKASPEQSE